MNSINVQERKDMVCSLGMTGVVKKVRMNEASVVVGFSEEKETSSTLDMWQEDHTM